MAKKRKKSLKRGPVVAKKTTVDGIKFQSGLEAYCYKQLKSNNLFDKYEEEKFQLLQGFHFENTFWSHQANGKGDFSQRGGKKILGISYTPDFTRRDYIIECKGRPNESFPIRFKLFKKWLVDNKDTRPVYMPKNQKDVDEMIRIILKQTK